MDEAAREAQEYIRQCEEDKVAVRKWRRKMLRTHMACSGCYGTGWDGDVDAYGRQVCYHCPQCEGSGWVPKTSEPNSGAAVQEASAARGPDQPEPRQQEQVPNADASGGPCLPHGLPFDAFGEPRVRYVRVSLDGNHCVMHPSEGDTYLKDARDGGDESPYVIADVYLSEREFEDLPEHEGF
jgi:hypothetical protein